MDDLQRITDRLAITELLVRYCIALDHMALDDLAALFTPECRVAYGPDERLQSVGAAALRSSLERMWRWSRTSHHLSNVLIEFDDDDTASATSYVLAWHERADGSTATVYGQYRDRIVRLEGRWLIDERRMLMNGNDAGFTLELFNAERNPAPPGWIAPDLD
ncbi:MAG: nuclear transport factor 2 family protein [Woeseiaceae bacterium]|nr:nuclear transport factor 2 family protein [Woeseiaceae bacterium]